MSRCASASEVEKEFSTYAGATVNITASSKKSMSRYGSTTTIGETPVTAEIVENRYFII